MYRNQVRHNKTVCIAIITNVLFIFDTLGRSLGMCCSERDQSTKRGGKLSLCKQVMVGTGIEHRHNGVKNVLKLYLKQFFQHIHIEGVCRSTLCKCSHLAG